MQTRMKINIFGLRGSVGEQTTASTTPSSGSQSVQPRKNLVFTPPSEDDLHPSSGDDETISDDEAFRALLRNCYKIALGQDKSENRDLVYAPPCSTVRHFVDITGCPAHDLRITSKGAQYFQGCFKNATLAGKLSDVERFLHAIPLRLRKAIEKVYCFIDNEAPSQAMRMYNGKWRSYLHGVHPETWKDAERERRKVSEELEEVLGGAAQVVQVFSNKSTFVQTLGAIMGIAINVPVWPEEESPGEAQDRGKKTSEQDQTRNHGSDCSAQRGGEHDHRAAWERAVLCIANEERELTHRQVYAGKRRKQLVQYDPKEAAFHFDHVPYLGW